MNKFKRKKQGVFDVKVNGLLKLLLDEISK